MPDLITSPNRPCDAARLESIHRRLEEALLAELTPDGHWEGFLSSSALSTAVAAFALSRFDPAAHQSQIARARSWLVRHQNRDGSWGDTTCSPGNLATTLLSLAALEGIDDADMVRTRKAAREWLSKNFGANDPATLRQAVIAFYGGDRTFSAPILALCTAAGILRQLNSCRRDAVHSCSTGKAGESFWSGAESPDHRWRGHSARRLSSAGLSRFPSGSGGRILGEPDRPAWKLVPQLPFELAVMPHRLWPHLRLAVVSYAIPALIAIGLVRHRKGGTRWSPLFHLRERTIAPALKVLHRAQPASGGYLEAAPLTGFVTMALSVAGLRNHPVAHAGAGFLRDTQRPDGSWPIDTNLATWLSTLAIKALEPEALPPARRERLLAWLLDQQHRVEHPFTHAAPGGWAWTHLSGGVPDGDDTAGALLALRKLVGEAPSPRIRQAAAAAVSWLVGLQNTDGGIPTFCRGWGKLPFDQSCPDITAHAIRAWMAWQPDLTDESDVHRRRLDHALQNALRYMEKSQRPDGSWVPRWFGSQHVDSHENPVFGTAQALISLAEAANPRLVLNLRRGEQFLLSAQNPDGSWGGAANLPSSIEETALALSALCAVNHPDTRPARDRAAAWLADVCEHALPEPLPAAPIGLYFASLWYHERLYPLIFATDAVRRFRRMTTMSTRGDGTRRGDS
jgi:squalene-hopene/tetraprenyl-beta-curcumene cyclase